MVETKQKDLTFLDILLRFLGPLVVVLATFNPSGYSLYGWLSNAMSTDGLSGIHFLAIVVLAIGWSILLVATWNALNTFGVILTCALLGAVVWVFFDWGLIEADSGDTIVWIVLVCLAILLAVGLSWAHIWKRMTGQYAVDEIDD